ncbi:putative methyltransferase YcgJ [Streptomyces sp. YIM 130001]|uniref:class I SAM-dependent methyltransferase n=1 Tax=Streptomyces sp. YIM 130001 TaxID=2259644 RepID=UPI000E64869B|nr:class I SAM-dependent methyltransferase [Streptomyces sp. YIM 130001]RII13931.1 putative methyltransferase YcgJ [Streptomyces sp. YIM 130001]
MAPLRSRQSQRPRESERAKRSGASKDAVHHPVFARVYARQSVASERVVAPYRRELLAGLSGRVIEIGAGNGLNFSHYPSSVSEVVAIEPERLLREIALTAARRAEVPVDVVPATAEALPVKSEAFDAVVLCLVLCSVRDVRRALAEVHRVLRPGGEVRFFEHELSPQGRAMPMVQRGLDRSRVWGLFTGGCHVARTPVASLAAAGFDEPEHRRMRLPERGPRTPVSYFVLGSARRPVAGGANSP